MTTRADQLLGPQRDTFGNQEREERVSKPGRQQEAKFPSPQAEAAAAKIRAAIAAGRVQARGRAIPAPSGMNKTERRYSEHLDVLRLAGEVAAWRFEAVTLKLGVDVRYSPDFLVILPGGELELHETKGFMRDDARVKLRCAARLFPFFTFRLVRWGKAGGWEIEEVPL
jgi:hypothetical protein